MKTSYFSKSGTNPNAIAISRGVPPWYKGKRFIDLAPTRAMLKMDEVAYDTAYTEILNRLDPEEVYSILVNMMEGEPILLCWEANVNECHRLRVSNWFEQNLNITIEELGKKRIPKSYFLGI